MKKIVKKTAKPTTEDNNRTCEPNFPKLPINKSKSPKTNKINEKTIFNLNACSSWLSLKDAPKISPNPYPKNLVSAASCKKLSRVTNPTNGDIQKKHNTSRITIPVELKTALLFENIRELFLF